MDKFRERRDFFKTLSSSKRKLDSLARILSGDSTCVAISVVDKRLIVAANELYQKSSPKNVIFTLIQKITCYFRGLANGMQVSDAQRKNVFLAICSFRRLKKIISKSNIAADEKLSNMIAEQIYEMGGD